MNILSYFLKALGALTVVFLLSACHAATTEAVISFENSGGAATPAVHIEIANTEAKRQLGLMYRKELADDAGMLFIFPSEAPRIFWMKDTYLELDMIFLDSRREVVCIVPKAVPLTETERRCDRGAMFVLEVPGGAAARWGLALGARAKIDGPLPAAS